MPVETEIEFDEQDFIVASLMQFTNPLIGQLLAGVGLPRSGTKEVLEARIVEALNKQTLTGVIGNAH